MKKILKLLAVAFVLVCVVAAGAYFSMRSKALELMDRSITVHRVDFPIPFPLTDAEIAAEGDALKDKDLAAVAKERAIARGKHLVEAFYVCGECHGRNFAGGTMVDDGAVGHFFGVNLTGGKGGQTASYTAADWDRIVRHGVKPDGKPTVMPAIDFAAMSDRELSDVVSYIRSMPPVDKEIPRPTYGPLGTVLLATGQIKLSADLIEHQKEHAKVPPPPQPDVTFGKHMAQVCVGCHNASFTGGPILGGPPDWPPAANLTPHAQGLQGWTLAEFTNVLKSGKRRDGTALRAPMDGMAKFAANWTDTETAAVFAFLQSLPPAETPQKK